MVEWSQKAVRFVRVIFTPFTKRFFNGISQWWLQYYELSSPLQWFKFNLKIGVVWNFKRLVTLLSYSFCVQITFYRTFYIIVEKYFPEMHKIVTTFYFLDKHFISNFFNTHVKWWDTSSRQSVLQVSYTRKYLCMSITICTYWCFNQTNFLRRLQNCMAKPLIKLSDRQHRWHCFEMASFCNATITRTISEIFTEWVFIKFY